MSLSVTIDCLSVSGEWPSSYAGYSINSLELEAVLLALHNFSRQLCQVVLLILSDNTMTVSCLTKQGGNHLARVEVRHILGDRNVLVDSLSRRSPVHMA